MKITELSVLLCVPLTLTFTGEEKWFASLHGALLKEDIFSRETKSPIGGQEDTQKEAIYSLCMEVQGKFIKPPHVDHYFKVPTDLTIE